MLNIGNYYEKKTTVNTKLETFIFSQNISSGEGVGDIYFCYLHVYISNSVSLRVIIVSQKAYRLTFGQCVKLQIIP